MTKRLFQESIAAFKESKIREAKEKAEKVTDDQLKDSESLQKKFNEIAVFNFIIATLKPEKKTGKRREIELSVKNFGDIEQVKTYVIDVTIPFDGYPKSFTICPTYCSVIDGDAWYDARGLVATFGDDKDLEKNIESFVQRVNENLDKLRVELGALGTSIHAAVQNVFDKRLAIIQTHRDLDKMRSFPIE